jgi:hypothetical protein
MLIALLMITFTLLPYLTGDTQSNMPVKHESYH